MRIAVVASVVAGCALTRNAPPLEVRYFAPEDATRPANTGARCGRVRVGRITASAHLRYRLVERTSATEVTLSDTRRWTEAPGSYVRRSLIDALFVAQPLAEALAGDAPTLDVDVLAFEAALVAGAHAGRVRLAYRLYDDDAVRATGVIAVERRAAPGPHAVVAAIGDAMHAATGDLAARVTRVVCARRAPGASAARRAPNPPWFLRSIAAPPLHRLRVVPCGPRDVQASSTARFARSAKCSRARASSRR